MTSSNTVHTIPPSTQHNGFTADTLIKDYRGPGWEANGEWRPLAERWRHALAAFSDSEERVPLTPDRAETLIGILVDFSFSYPPEATEEERTTARQHYGAPEFTDTALALLNNEYKQVGPVKLLQALWREETGRPLYPHEKNELRTALENRVEHEIAARFEQPVMGEKDRGYSQRVDEVPTLEEFRSMADDIRNSAGMHR